MARRGSDSRKAIENLLSAVAAAPGWSWQRSSHGYKIRTPEGVPIFCAATPSDIRATRNVRAQLRRHGLDC